MVKRLLSISVALGTDLNTKERLFIAARVFGLGLIILLLVAFGITLWEYMLYSKVIVFSLFALLCFLLSYIVTSYLLHSFLQKNSALDTLLKETLHELNIPLTVINANVHMLSKEETDAKKLKRLERIVHAGEDLKRLYQDVDYFIKQQIEREVKESFYLDEIVQTVVDKYHDILEGCAVECEVLHVEILADKNGFMKVVSNILSNAIKYNTGKNTIRIIQKKNTLSILDEGIGMDERELFLIFDRYYQVDSSKAGHGIGLSLVKAYCDRSKIGLSILSEKNQGTQVILEISNLLIKK